MNTMTEVALRETIISTNPATGEKLGELTCATPEEVHAGSSAGAAGPTGVGSPCR